MPDVSRDEFYRAVDDIKELVGGINGRLDTLNGRTRRAEIKIAIMWVLWFIVGSVALAWIQAPK